MYVLTPRRWLAVLVVVLCAAATSPISGTLPSPHASSTPVAVVAAPQAHPSVPAPVQAAASASIGRDRSAYHAQPRGAAIHLANDAQQIEADMVAGGVTARVGGGAWQFALEEHGRGAARIPASPAAPTATANRIEYQRGALTEWYVNGPMGLEQGFTIETPPADAPGGPVTLALASSGDLTVRVDEGGRGLTLIDRSGTPVLRYAGLAAFDATKRDLPARMSLEGTQVVLSIDDRLAQYPITVDPVLQRAVFWPTNTETWSYGSAVAVSENTIVVGDPGVNDQAGVAYVYVKTSGGWTSTTETAVLTASDRTVDGRESFGTSVAISGDTIVVGAPGKAGAAGLATGAVYVFTKPAQGWTTATETATLTPSDAAAYDLVGLSVGISGDTIVASGRKAYVFTKPAGGWASGTETTKLGVTSSLAFTSVAIDGKYIVASDANWSNSAGIVYVFTKGTNGWSPSPASLRPSGAIQQENFGASIAIAGDMVAVGAPSTRVSPNGTVYVFKKATTSWVGAQQVAMLSATDAEPQYGALVGRSVAIGADAIVTGTSRAAFVYVKPIGHEWANATETAKVVAWGTDTPEYAYMGMSVAMTGDTFVVGAPWEFNGVGAAYIGSLVPDTSLLAITDLVDTRASQASVDALATSIGSRAAQESVDALAQTINGLSAGIGGRASQASVDLLGVSVAGLGGYMTTRSSQASVDALGTEMSGMSGVLVSRASQSSVDALAGSLGQLDAPVSSRASQSTADAILAKVDACSPGPGDSDAALRRWIERALADGKRVVSFYLPASLHGDLDLVRQIVDELITAANAAGINVSKALKELVQGDTAYAAGAYKEAYDAYARAYGWLLK